MKNIFSTVVCLGLAAMMLSSCVSKRKYVAARNRADAEHAANVTLSNHYSSAEDSINALSGQVGALGDIYASTNKELNMSKEQIAAQRERVKQLESFIASQQASVEALRKKIADALTGFNANELTVTMKDGKVYVSMQESLLFPSGSAVVNPRGKEALAKVAGVLNTNPDINIDIEGHTDNVPIHSKTFADNWALSVTRATSVAHVLIDEYSVSPTRLIASGRGQYEPIASNDSPEGRAHNRRTEIILEPKLDELMKIMDGAPVTNK